MATPRNLQKFIASKKLETPPAKPPGIIEMTPEKSSLRSVHVQGPGKTCREEEFRDSQLDAAAKPFADALRRGAKAITADCLKL